MRIFRHALTALGTFACITTTAWASVDEPSSDWQPSDRFVKVHAGGDGTVAYVDKESIVRDGNVVTYWSFYDTRHVRTNPLRLSMNVQKVDCSNRTFMWLETGYVLPNGRRLLYLKQKDTGWHYVVPATDGESEMRFVCQQQAGAAAR